jgi:hypothetical protein
LTEIDGRFWCFVANETPLYCRHAEESKRLMIDKTTSKNLVKKDLIV